MCRNWALALVLVALPATAAVDVSVCFNYGCLSEARVRLPERLLSSIGGDLAGAVDARSERERVARAVGRMYREAGRQSPIAADRAGDYDDDGAYGKMDCIDHAVSTTRLLQVLEARGLLHFHRVGPQVRRTRFLIFQHFSAMLEEIGAEPAGEAPRRYVVDSWFVEQGEPAVVLPLDAWLDGEGPNVQ